MNCCHQPHFPNKKPKTSHRTSRNIAAVSATTLALLTSSYHDRGYATASHSEPSLWHHQAYKSPHFQSETDQWQYVARGLAQAIGGHHHEQYDEYILALFTQESRWNVRAESETGALGIGQITSIVFEDMRIRREKYLPILLRVMHTPGMDTILSSELWIDFSGLSEHMPESTWSAWVDALQSRVEKHDPYANILVSLLCFEVKYESTTEQTAEKFMNTLKSLDAEISLPDEPTEQRLTEAVRRYNGDRRYIKWREVRDWHTLKVLEHYQKNTAWSIAREHGGTGEYAKIARF